MEKSDLQITLIKNQLRTDSRLLASLLDHRHRTILESIDKYISQLGELGSLPFETEKGIALETGGFAKATRYALLNEDQCYFVLTLMRNNTHVVKSKLALVKAFRAARTTLAQQQLARCNGKEIRHQETSAIGELVDYAMAKGSKNADKYYMSITKMTNAVLNIEAGQRDNLPEKTLTEISIIENIVRLTIHDGINADMPYKDIFQLAKERCKLISSSIKLLK